MSCHHGAKWYQCMMIFGRIMFKKSHYCFPFRYALQKTCPPAETPALENIGKKNLLSNGGTHWNLVENIKEQGDEVYIDPCSSKALFQVLGHGDHLNTAHLSHHAWIETLITYTEVKNLLQLWGRHVQTTSQASTQWTEPDRKTLLVVILFYNCEQFSFK